MSAALLDPHELPGADMPAGPFDLVYADPGWQYRDSLNMGKRGAAHKYTTLDYRDLARLPVRSITADDCLLAMWWTAPLVHEALFVVEAWGFRVVTMKGFTWEKLTKNGGAHYGLGHWTRGNTEDCLFAVKGRPKRVHKGIPQLIRAPIRGHSQKPDEARTALELLLGDVRRVELFARQAFAGWCGWGDGLGYTIAGPAE